MPDARRQFLEDLHLPPNIPEYKYAGLSKLIEAVDEIYHRFVTTTPSSDDDSTAPSPIVVFTHLSPSEFRKLERMDKLPGKGDYIASMQLFILKPLSGQHEVAAGSFGGIFSLAGRDMGVWRTVIPLGGTNFHTRDRSKQADLSWIPKFCPEGRSKDWPTWS